MRKKKILLIILPILLVLIIAGVVAGLYFATDIFRSSDELFAKYVAQNGELFDIIKNDNIDEQNTFKATNSYTSTGNLSVVLQNGASNQEVKATTSSRHDNSTGRTYSDMTLKNGEADLLKISYINSGDVYAIKCDDVLGNYIGIRNKDLKTFAKNMGVSETDVQNIPDMIDLQILNSLTDITEEQKTHIIDTYSKVIFESIPKDKYAKLDKSNISVDGTNYVANGYQLVIDLNTAKQIVINCLTTLKDDNTTLVMISNKLSSLGLDSQYTDITVLSEGINNIITQIQNASTEGDNTNDNITITVYANAGKTIRTEVAISDQLNITIDKTGTDDSKKAIITLQSNNTSNITSQQENSTTNTTVSQIILQKMQDESNITNETTVIPDTTNMAQTITLNTTLGKLNNNTFNNTSNITISNSSDGINVEKIQTSYLQNVQATNQIEEIMELKNSNSIIVNNYTLNQLTPFLTSLGNKITQVIPSKIAQLGINLQSDTTQLATILGSAGISIANTNGIDMGNVVMTGAVGGLGIGMYVYSSSLNVMDNAEASLNTQDAQAYNALFESYKGTQKGSTVGVLCDTILNHNLNNPTNQIMVQMSNATNITNEVTGTVASETIDNIKNQIKPDETYEIDFGYSSSTGKIVAIGIVKK